MRFLRLLCWFVFGLAGGGVLALMAADSHAAFPAPTAWLMDAGGVCINSPYGPNKAATLTAAGTQQLNNCYIPLYPQFAPVAMTGCTQTTSTTGSCTYTRNGGLVWQTVTASVVTQCPANSTGSTTCTCNPGYTEQGQTCVVTPACPSAGTTVPGLTGSVYVSGNTSTFCWNGCSAKGGYTVGGETGGVYTTSIFGPFTYSGATCNGGNPGQNPQPTDQPPPTPCGIGTCPGTVNGVSVCLKCGGGKTTTGTTTTTTPDASGGTKTTDVKTETTIGGGGQVTTTTTTTTTTTPPGGGTPTVTTQVDTKTEDQKSFCESNPNLQICKDSSFGGTCSNFSCSGDAVQCAMAKEQHTRNCRLFDDVTTESTLGQALQADNDPLKSQFPTDASQRQTVNFSNIVQATRTLGSQCPQDLTVTISGRNVAIPFSNLCTPMTWIGHVIVALCLVGAIRYVAEGL